MNLENNSKIKKNLFFRDDLIIVFLSLPLYAAAIGSYGWRVGIILLMSILIGSVIEISSFKLNRKPIDYLGIAAWFILPLVFPPDFPIWMIAVSIFFGILIGVVFFGGHGREIASPVAIGWAFGILSFAREYEMGWVFPFSDFKTGLLNFSASVPTIDHTITYLKEHTVSLGEILTGHFPQVLGNSIPIVLLVCGIIVLLLRAVDAKTSLSFIITVIVLTFISVQIDPKLSKFIDALFVGNLFFAAFFILPVRQTSGRACKGKIITGIICGAVAFMIRTFSSFPDGVLFAVLFANVFTALIDELVLGCKYKKVKQ